MAGKRSSSSQSKPAAKAAKAAKPGAAKKSPKSEFPEKPFIHPLAAVDGLVEMGEGCSIWAGAVLRGDMNRIRLGRYVNIQENSTLHVESTSTIEIGDYSLIGHHVMLHGCHIGRAVMIGIGSIVLDHAVIGDGAMVTAGCMIRGGKKIPPRALVLGHGGDLKIIPNAAKTAMVVAGSLEYVELARRYLRQEWGPFPREQELAYLHQAREIIAAMGI